MSTPRPGAPRSRETCPLRVLAAIALLAVTVCAVSVTILAWQAITATDGVREAADRVAESSRDLDPAIRELRRAAPRPARGGRGHRRRPAAVAAPAAAPDALATLAPSQGD